MIFVKNYKVVKKNAGFTLVELVLILVLLGILGAVAVPKYFDLQDEAQQKAARLAVAEAQSRIEARFSELILNGETCSAAVAEVKVLKNLSDSTKDDQAVFGDYGLSAEEIASTGTEVTVKVLGDEDREVVFSGSQPKLYVPACAEERITADRSPEAFWKVINMDDTLKEYFSKTANIDLRSYDRDNTYVKLLETLVSDLGFDVENKVWTVGQDGENLRVYVADITIAEAKDPDFVNESKVYVKAGYYDSKTKTTSYGYVRIRYDDGNPTYPTGNDFKNDVKDHQKYENWKNNH